MSRICDRSTEEFIARSELTCDNVPHRTWLLTPITVERDFHRWEE
jgi:hypothetical protein